MDECTPVFPSGKREFAFSLLMLLCGWLLANSILYAGFHLGFALFSSAVIVLSAGYLLLRGKRLSIYSGLLLGLSLVICASFARSDDGFVKFVMVCFLAVSTNLGLCLLAGQNRRNAAGLSSLLDAPRAVFSMGIGRLSPALRGLFQGIRNGSTAGKKGSAILLGLLIAAPVLLLLIYLLSSADAAFDALIRQLPDMKLEELPGTVIFGSVLACFLYTRAAALNHAPKNTTPLKTRKGIPFLTVNTILIAIGVVYGVYLVSQLAYFSGGFSGILPEDYTVAQYARRGFFEMAWLCAINLLLIALSIGLVSGPAPKSTRILCLFLGLVTVFLAAAASAKMFLYIGSYGLTRLRVLTQVIIFWLGLSTILVCVWLFLPKLPYMKAVLLLALIMGAIVAWADVDTVVARHNVAAYQSGRLETVDVYYLDSLGHGAVPYIAQLQQDGDPEVAQRAKEALSYGYYGDADFRGWNYVNYIAESYIND